MLAERIKQFRRNNGMTQKEFAEACNLRQNTISQYEAGGRFPGIHSMFTIAQLMGCTVEELLREEEGNHMKETEDAPNEF